MISPTVYIISIGVSFVLAYAALVATAFLWKSNTFPRNVSILFATCQFYNFILLTGTIYYSILLYFNPDNLLANRILYLFYGYTSVTFVQLIFLINCEILKIFVVLIERITLKLVNRFRLTSLIVFNILLLPLYIFSNDRFLGFPAWKDISDINSNVVVLFNIGYDNIQSIYLIFLLFRWKKVHFRKLPPVILLLAFTIIIDWLGIALSVYQTFYLQSDTFNNSPLDSVTTAIMCIHSSMSMFTFKELKSIAVKKRKIVPVRLPPVRNVSAPQIEGSLPAQPPPEPTLDINFPKTHMLATEMNKYPGEPTIDLNNFPKSHTMAATEMN